MTYTADTKIRYDIRATSHVKTTKSVRIKLAGTFNQFAGLAHQGHKFEAQWNYENGTYHLKVYCRSCKAKGSITVEGKDAQNITGDYALIYNFVRTK